MSVDANELRTTAKRLRAEAARDETRSAVAGEIVESLAPMLAEHVAARLSNGELSVRFERLLAEASEHGQSGDRVVGYALAGLLVDLARRAERHVDALGRGWLVRAAEARGRAVEREALAETLCATETAAEGGSGPEAPGSTSTAESAAERLDGPVRGPVDCLLAGSPLESLAESPEPAEGQGPTLPENGPEPAAHGGGEPVPSPIGTRPPEVSP